MIALVAALRPEPANAEDRNDDTWSTLYAVRLATPHVIGLRASLTEVNNNTSDVGLALWMHGTGYHEGDINFRSATGIRLGQTNGIEGGLSSDLAIGRRFDITDDGGVFVRGGVRGFGRGLGFGRLVQRVIQRRGLGVVRQQGWGHPG